MLDVSRKELKYVISTDEVTGLRGKLSAVMQEDSHNGSDGYRVRSLYFDTLSDRDFEEKVDGYDKRQKIRLRIYGFGNQTVKLELKAKENGFQRKRSLSVSREEAEQMIRCEYGFLMGKSEPLAHYIYTLMTTRCYRPKCIVEYDRIAYCMDTNEIRVTFDMNLRATEADVALFDEDLPLYPVANRAETTMEVKYNGFLFTHIKNIIKTSDRMQVSNSKYCRARTITKRGRR